MSIYLHDIPLPRAKERWESSLRSAGLWDVLGVETIPLDDEALGRVLAKPVWARISSPHFHSAAMDGFAVHAEDTEGALETFPINLMYGTQAVYVDTGDPLPPWANAVIPIENIEPLDERGSPASDPRKPETVRIRAATIPWGNVRAMGEDMVASQLVLPAGHILRPVDLGAIAGCGHDRIHVARRPRVAVIPTGSELVPIGEEINVGNIIEYNSLVLASQIKEWGGKPTRYPITPDDPQAIENRVVEAAKHHDLILLIAGSSAGSEDFSAEVVKSLGELLVHGVAVRPGHPVILGMIQLEGPSYPKPIIGVPGYPVSAAITGEIFVEPILARWLGRRPLERNEIEATLTRKVTSPAGDVDFMRVAVGKVADRTLAAPLSRGAGVISSLVRADGIVVIPSGSQGYPAGEKVNVRLYRSLKEIERTIFAIGSHDISLDLLAQSLARQDRWLSSANVGSLGGLVALRRTEAHIAGSHLLDTESGDYNISYIHRYLPNIPVSVVAFVEREQGLFVKKGNPKGIQSLEDLVRDDVSFVNRQRGAGTRVLLDYHLGLLGIDPQTVKGYDQEEYTHLTVSSAVASGRADCGLGITAAAYALDLDFIPLYHERYDLIIPQEYIQGSLLTPVFDILHYSKFQQAVQEMPGYGVSQMGEVIAEIG